METMSRSRITIVVGVAWVLAMLILAGLLALTARVLLPPAETQPLASRTVDASEGAVVASRDGRITLEIPPGALESDTQITIRSLAEDTWAEDIKDISPVGPVFSLEPEGLEFSQPVKVSVRLDPQAAPPQDTEPGDIPLFVALSRTADGAWEVLPSVITEIQAPTGVVIVSGELSHFSRLMFVDGPLQVGIQPPSVSGAKGTTWPADVFVANLSHTRKLVSVDPIAYIGIEVVGVARDGPLSIAPPPPRGLTEVSPRPQYVCADNGKGDYGVHVQARVEPTFADEFMAGLGALDTKEGEQGREAFEQNLRRLTTFNAYVWGDAKCGPLQAQSAATTPPVEVPPEEGITGEDTPPEQEGDTDEAQDDDEEEGPEEEEAATSDLSGTYEGALRVKFDPDGHEAFGQRAGAVAFEVVVDGGTVTIPLIPGWNLIAEDRVGNVAEGTFTATGQGPYASFSGVSGVLKGTLSPEGQLTGELTIGVNGELPGGRAVTYSVEAQRTGPRRGVIIAEDFDAATGETTEWVDLDGDGQPDVVRRYDENGELIDERAVDQGGVVTASVFDASTGVEWKWVDTDGDGQADVVRRYDEEGNLIEERSLEGTVVEADFDASTGVTTEWIDLDGDGEPDVIRRYDREGELIEEEDLRATGTVTAETYDAGTGITTQWVDVDGDGLADVVREYDEDGELIEERELDVDGMGVIISESYDAAAGVTLRVVDVDSDGLADVLRKYDDTETLIEENQLDEDGLGAIISETYDADTGVTEQWVDTIGDGEPDVLRRYDENNVLIEESELVADGSGVLLMRSIDPNTSVATHWVDLENDGEVDVLYTYGANGRLIQEREIAFEATGLTGSFSRVAILALCTVAALISGLLLTGAALLIGRHLLRRVDQTP